MPRFRAMRTGDHRASGHRLARRGMLKMADLQRVTFFASLCFAVLNRLIVLLFVKSIKTQRTDGAVHY